MKIFIKKEITYALVR